MRERAWTQEALEGEVRAATKVFGLRRKDAPGKKVLADAINGRVMPSAVTILLLRHVTNGEVDLQHWVREVYAKRR